jgi:hypothetical protein
MQWDEREEVLQESNGVLLLLPWSVNISKEEGNVMATNQSHEACVVKAIHVGLLFISIGSFV